MKILQVAPAWIDTPAIKGYGGTEWVIFNLTKGLKNLGHDVTLYATKKSSSPGKLKYTFTKSFIDLGFPWEAALPALIHYHQAFKLAREFDVVHAHLSSQTDIIILPFLSDLVDQGIPCVMTIHGHFPYDRYTFMDKYFLKYYASKIPVINISKTMQGFTPRQFKKATVIHNSMDLTQIKFNPKPENYLTWLGKITPDKGTHEAIEIAKKAGEKLIFAGVVDLNQRISREYFDSKVKPLIDGKQIIYLGPADLKLKSKMLSKAKGFLNPINWVEPFGMVMVESLAAGTPVITYSKGAAKEIIIDKKTGFLVETKSEMIKAIKKLDQIKRKDCRQHVEKNFSPEVAALAHLKIYKKIIVKSNSLSKPAPRIRKLNLYTAPRLVKA